MALDTKRTDVLISCNGKDCLESARVISREKVPEGWASVIVFLPSPNNKVYLLCPDCLIRTVK